MANTDLTNGLRDIDIGTPLVVMGEGNFRAALASKSGSFIVRRADGPGVGIIGGFGDRVGIYIGTAGEQTATAILSGGDFVGDTGPAEQRGERFYIRDIKPLPPIAGSEIRKPPRSIVNAIG